MLQKLKNLIYTKYKPEDKIGFFFSLFDNNGKLLISNGVINTDRSLEDTINLFYNGMLQAQESKTKHVIIDIINNITPQNNVNTFLTLDPKIYGVLLSETGGDKTGVMLPNTKGIENMKQAIAGIKKKYQLQGNVSISTFTVDELILNR